MQVSSVTPQISLEHWVREILEKLNSIWCTNVQNTRECSIPDSESLSFKDNCIFGKG